LTAFGGIAALLISLAMLLEDGAVSVEPIVAIIGGVAAIALALRTERYFPVVIAILWVLVSTALLVGRDQGWHWYVVAPVSAAIAIAAFYTLYLAMPKRGEYVEEFH